MAFVNGVEYSWSSLRFAFLGNNDVKGVKAINYKVTRESTNLYGAGDEPVSVGYGNKVYEGEIQLMMKDVRAIRQAAGNKSLVDILPFSIIVQYANGSDPIVADTLTQCSFLEDGMSGDQGANELPVTIPLRIGGIIFGG